MYPTLSFFVEKNDKNNQSSPGVAEDHLSTHLFHFFTTTGIQV